MVFVLFYRYLFTEEDHINDGDHKLSARVIKVPRVMYVDLDPTDNVTTYDLMQVCDVEKWESENDGYMSRLWYDISKSEVPKHI